MLALHAGVRVHLALGVTSMCTHQGRWCFGKKPMQTFLDSRRLTREKQQIGEAA